MRARPQLAGVATLPASFVQERFVETSNPAPRPYVAEDEASLIDRAVSGDRLAARAIYDTHVIAIHRLASRIVGADLAEECTQDAFVRAFERLGSFRRQAALRTWLHSITVSVALNHKRRERRQSRYLSLDVAPDIASTSPECDPLLTSRIHGAIDALTEDLRTVVILGLIEGRTHQEIGEILDIPEGTSKARLSRARAQLREALADVAPANA
jgi:RNA polymerase sigma-70 factor, ECF subfamily